MMKSIALISYLLFFFCSYAQDDFLRTKEGRPIMSKKELVKSCLLSLNKAASDPVAIAICECQVDRMDLRFSNKQFKKYSGSSRVDVLGLLKSDSLVQRDVNQCYLASGRTVLLRAEASATEFISECISGIQKLAVRKTDEKRLEEFCNCQLNMVKSKQLTDKQIDEMLDPNSLLYYEMLYQCGDPLMQKDIETGNWNKGLSNDITGPASDTIRVLSLNGMTFLKVKIGSLVRVWLFDTGAEDMMITKQMEDSLRKENVLSSENFVGVRDHEPGNGIVEQCRLYKVNNVQLGSFNINNVTIAVSDGARKIRIGKSLLNKFSRYQLDNRENTLILSK